MLGMEAVRFGHQLLVDLVEQRTTYSTGIALKFKYTVMLL